MSMKLLAAVGLCGVLLAACSQKTEDKAAEATGTAGAAASQAGDAVQSAGSDAVANTQAAAAKTATAAMEEGFRLAAEGTLGGTNRKLAIDDWSAEQCALRYVEFYRQVINS